MECNEVCYRKSIRKTFWSYLEKHNKQANYWKIFSKWRLSPEGELSCIDWKMKFYLQNVYVQKWKVTFSPTKLFTFSYSTKQNNIKKKMTNYSFGQNIKSNCFQGYTAQKSNIGMKYTWHAKLLRHKTTLLLVLNKQESKS